jgi:transmembrane sensor
MTAGQDASPSADTDAQAVEAAAAEWFGRQQFWYWTEDDQAALNAWLDEALAHKVAYWRLAAAWQRTERLYAVPRLSANRRPQPDRQGSSRLFRFAVMAAAVLIVMLGAGAYFSFAGTAQVYTTGIGESRTINLADGSQVELNTDTVLDAAVGTRNRTVTLEKGEAFFRIRHDADHPFVVMVAGHRITDLGTKFTVRREGNRAQIVLVEGKARVETAPSDGLARSATLVPGEVAMAAPGALTVRKPSAGAVSDILAWRSRILVFDGETLGEAAAEFNRYNKTKFVINDSAVAAIPIAGRFPTDGVDRFADVVRHVFGLHVQTGQDTVVIGR